ncbi:MAG: 7-cyano-7-deazaguanine synthase [Limnoraphis sp. WC205]|jgi:asparagine synthase (glutamine-hydrolysing)|nr:7-cyano-7-deazaguanine synthase [Limnoraphis sp. WC205]
MIFKAFKKTKNHLSPHVFTASWCVAWGRLNTPSTDAIWQDEQFAVISLPHSELLAISSSEQFVIFGDIWLTNQAELYHKLGVSAQHFLGNDQQLVAELWTKWGWECLPFLVGMYAFVVWDRQKQTLWIIRDRVGSRTLYYTNTGSVRWISPQLKTLSPYRSSDLDLVALRDYLCCAFVPGERTLWQDIKEVRPATAIQFPSENQYSYWQLQEDITASDESLAWHGESLRVLLNQVVQDYLPQNQTVGVFLSGGLDSSCITALAAKLHNQTVHTYSIHFGSESPNELEFSTLVAEHCQTNHHILEITFSQMWEYLPEAMFYLDDPIGDPLTVPNLLLGKLASKDVQVILNGEGGDPCFGGPKNQPMLINSLYGSVTKQDSLTAYLSSFKKCSEDLPQLLKPEIYTAIQAENSVFYEDLNSNVSYLNRLMALNIKFKGADQILTKVNNLTSSLNLQGRSPLFDQRIVDLSMQIPPEYKLSGVEEKAVLKQAVKDILPDAIIHRPKSGMMVPVQLGFRKYWQKEARKLLLNRKSLISPYLNQSMIKDWLNYRGDTWGRYGVKLWLLASLEMWLQVHKK